MILMIATINMTINPLPLTTDTNANNHVIVVMNDVVSGDVDDVVVNHEADDVMAGRDDGWLKPKKEHQPLEGSWAR